jgi:tRNA (guanine-N7-)-methyltransferase
MLAAVLADGRFDWPVHCAADWRVPPADHSPTRYEAKRLGDCAPVWLDFIRRPA